MRGPDIGTWISVAVALVALVISFTTLFLSHIRNPDIKAIFGPIKVYRNFHEKGGLGFLAIVTFANKALKTGLVIRAALLVRKEGDLGQGYFMKWREFNRLDPDKKEYVFEDEAHAISISGNSTVTRQIWFDYYDPSFILEMGTYVVTVCFWREQDGAGKPKMESCAIEIDESIYKELELYRTNHNAVVRDVPLKGELPAHKPMDKNEMKNILGI